MNSSSGSGISSARKLIRWKRHRKVKIFLVCFTGIVFKLKEILKIVLIHYKVKNSINVTILWKILMCSANISILTLGKCQTIIRIWFMKKYFPF